MGKRVRRKWDLPAGRTQALLVLCAAFFLGGLAGALFAGMSDGAGAEELRGYLCDYLVLAGDGAAVQNFGALIWEQFSVLLLSLLLGALLLQRRLFGLQSACQWRHKKASPCGL